MMVIPLAEKRIRGLRVDIVARDEKGREVARKNVTSSFMLGFFAILFTQLSGTNAPITVKDTTGTARTLSGSQGTNTYAGINVGTGTVPSVPDQSNVETMIANGSGSGQLVYGSTTFGLGVSGNKITLTISISFTNSSGADITATEVGLFTHAISTSGTEAFIVDRTLMSLPFPAGQMTNVAYELSSQVA